MAIVDIATEGVPLVFPLATVPDVISKGTVYPRALVRFAQTPAIAAKQAADQTHWTVTLPLPENFAYSLSECVVGVFNSVAAEDNDFDVLGTLDVANMSPHTNQTAHYSMVSQGNTPYGGLAGAWRNIKLWRPVETPKGVWAPVVGAQVQLIIRLADESADASGVATGVIQALLFMYDLDQFYYTTVHTPEPVMLR